MVVGPTRGRLVLRFVSHTFWNALGAPRYTYIYDIFRVPITFEEPREDRYREDAVYRTDVFMSLRAPRGSCVDARSKSYSSLPVASQFKKSITIDLSYVYTRKVINQSSRGMFRGPSDSWKGR